MDPRPNPSSVTWDVLIVGTGMGGATLGYELARQGRRVLFVEKGRSSLVPSDDSIRDRLPDDRDDLNQLSPTQRLELLARGGRSTEEVLDLSARRPATFTPFIGTGTGGSSALYGMALERLFAEDFTPRLQHAQADGTSLPESWPLSYDEFRGWYRATERLYRVHGTPDPLRPW